MSNKNYNVMIQIGQTSFDLKYNTAAGHLLDPQMINQVIDYIKKGKFSVDDVSVILQNDKFQTLREPSIDNNWSKLLPQLEEIRKLCRVEGLKNNLSSILPFNVK